MSIVFLYKNNKKLLRGSNMLHKELTEQLQNLTKTKVSQQAIGNILGLAQTAISFRIKTDKEYSIDELIKIEQAMGLSMGSLSGVSSSDITLDFYPDVFGSCGTGCMVFSEAKEKLAVTKDIITNYSASNQYSIIVARGRSNEPTIMNEDKLVVEHVKDNAIIDNQLYVFSYEGQIYVKRLIKNIDELVIISDNPDKEVYRTQYVTKNNINNVNIIGKIVGLIRDKV
jgi:phage repressor protein C with HTH and peptisase S24 domain